MAMELLRRFAQGIRLGKSEPVSQWRTPKTLDQGNLGEACLALDGNSHGSALWENDGRLWTLPIGPGTKAALARLPLGEGTTPRIMLNPNGRGLAIWQQEAAGERHVLGMILGSGGQSAQVVFRTTGKVQHLQAAVDRRGNALVVWLHEKDGSFDVMAQAFDTRGQTWEQRPTTLGLGSVVAVQPRIAVNHREHAMVLWEVQEGAFEGLVASHYWPADRIWSDRPMPVVARATHQHQVVIDDLGNALALWINTPYGQRSTLEASFYDAHLSEWSEPEFLSSAQAFSLPRLVMTGNGEAMAAWCQGEGHGPSRLYAKSFLNRKWDANVECLELGREPVRDFTIAMGPEGAAGVIAVQQGTDGDRIFVRLRQGPWSAPVQLGATSQAPLSSPRLVLCPAGASALWMQGVGKHKALTLAETI